MKKEWLETLSNCALFHGISCDELRAVLQCFNPRVHTYEKNEIIKIAGDKFAEVGLVLTGEVAITKENAAGSRVIIGMVGPGDMFGEMAAFSGNDVWPATVTAQEPSTIMFLPCEKIVGNCQKVCVNHKQLIKNMLRIISNKALILNRKLEYVTIKDLRGKISTFLLEHHKKTGKTTFMLPLKRNELADFLNVSRPSLSREMCKMRDEGLIEFHRKSIKIKDVNALKGYVQ